MTGKLQMEQLVQVYGKKENEAELISGLLDILKSREKYSLTDLISFFLLRFTSME